MGRPKENNGICKLCGAPVEMERNVRGNGASYMYTRSICQMCKRRAYKRQTFKSFQCERCGWQGYCDTHHKDGNHDNNNEENLETLCPNCHRSHHSPIPNWLLETLETPSKI